MLELELEWDSKSESQEAASKGEKIFNIDSIMPEIYGGQRERLRESVCVCVREIPSIGDWFCRPFK